MMPSFGVAPSPAYHVKRLQQKRETITALVDALETYLAFEIDEQLDSFEKASAAGPPKSSVTPEMLVNAQTELAAMEGQIEAFTTMGDNFSEELAPMFNSMRAMMGGLLGPSLQRQRDTVKMLQNSLDGKINGVMCECGAMLMEDGTVSRGPINPTEMFQGTIEECEVKSREGGWLVDGMDHKCPECAAK